ncbi:MAG TPA: tRNA (adenosine(37)-N6)-threonylcarbamoyltransferase complex ATPase subunit type 1 TsaE [Acidimicrobiales bacterium]|jgi:tRNA threonylcarbamoyladenosine biosynthesis protein TsaE|nr:tRNA (adenosine(37)-N6)-threonylcarbamoyltransferase complex ATPase subunit type 1 TsaE [Acidimicrobiales bacterium]
MTAPGAAIVVASAGPEETQALAAAIAPLCRAGDVLLLAGDLGSGKTTFAQGFGRGLGITEPITSPTFALVREYRLHDGAGESGPGLTTLLHADVYRLEQLGEIAELGLGELVEDGAVALVEWGDVAEPVLGEGALSLRLEAGPEEGDDRRTVTIGRSGRRWADRWERLSDVLAPWAVGG